MKKRILILTLVLVAAGAAFWAFRFRAREKPFLLSGSIESRDAEVGSLLGGRVLKVHAEEGDHVAAGATLVTLETDLIEIQIREQRARLDEARALQARTRSGPRREDVARARADWENAERERGRYEALLDQGVIGQQQYDTAATRAKTAQEAYRELSRGSRSEDIAAAAAAVEREEGRLAYLMRQREEAVVRAPAAGIVEALDLRPGDLVAANQPVARILEPDQLWVRVYVPEPALGLVRVGQKAAITVDSFPKREFAGKIVEIRDRAEYTPRNVQTLDQRMDQVFGVKIEIGKAPELKPGMAAVVRLEE